MFIVEKNPFLSAILVFSGMYQTRFFGVSLFKTGCILKPVIFIRYGICHNYPPSWRGGLFAIVNVIEMN